MATIEKNVEELLANVGDEAVRNQLRELIERKAYKAPQYDGKAVHENAEKAANTAIESVTGNTKPYELASILVVDGRSKFGRFFKSLPRCRKIAGGGFAVACNLTSREQQDAWLEAYCDYVNEATGTETCAMLVEVE